MPIQFRQLGGSAYLRFDDGTVVDATAGSGVDGGTYSVSDAALDTAGLTTGKRFWRAFLGTASGSSASDTPIGVEGSIVWSTASSAEVLTPTTASVAAGVQETLIGSGVTPGTYGTWDPDSPLYQIALAADSVDTKLTSTRAGKLDSLLASGTVAASTDVSGSGTVTAEDIDERLTWTFPRSGSGTQASNIVGIKSRTDAARVTRVQFDLTGVLEEDATIASVGTVTVSDTGATAATAELHTSKRKVNVPLSAITTPGSYTVTLPYTTTTGQELDVTGTLEVR